jgi:hypothetical protein
MQPPCASLWRCPSGYPLDSQTCSILMVQKHHTSLFSIERFALPKSHQVGRIKFMPGRYTATGELAMWMVVYVATVALLSFAFIPALTIDE